MNHLIREELIKLFRETHSVWYAPGGGLGPVWEAAVLAKLAELDADHAKEVAELKHTIHTKVPALETAMVLQGEKIAELTKQVAQAELAAYEKVNRLWNDGNCYNFQVQLDDCVADWHKRNDAKCEHYNFQREFVGMELALHRCSDCGMVRRATLGDWEKSDATA
jgi:hypothetical protein